jgi:hypothetical protein
MNRMMRILALKFLALRDYIPLVELNQARHSYLETENLGYYCGRHHSLIDRLLSELIPSHTPELSNSNSRNDVFLSGL